MNVVAISTMSAKFTALGIPKIKVFWNKGYGAIIYIRDFTDKILSGDSSDQIC